jgi:hypothetical protein
MEPLLKAGLMLGHIDRGSRSRIKIADTKHFKNRVYSSRTLDVFSASDIAARQ